MGSIFEPTSSPGTGSSRVLRRQLLRQVVTDNVDTITGRRNGPAREARRRGAAGWVAGGVVLLLGAAGGLAAWLGGGSAAPPAVSEAPPGVERQGISPRTLMAEATAVRLGVPRPLDGAVFPLAVRRIVLDPGHGGRDVGTLTPEGLYEKDVALDIARRLRDMLESRGGLEVVLTRDEDAAVSLRERARIANESRADLFLSIHVNSLQPTSLRGIETFFLGPTEDPYLVQLTSRENHESGYSLSDVRRLLDGIYLDLRQEQSKLFATAVQRRLHASLADVDDRGVKPAPFLVLVATEMPAVLAEVSCLSNPSEAERLATPEYRQTIAEALLAGIETYTFGLSQTGAGGSLEG